MAQEAATASASAFPLPEIPVKLRCTICKNLARDAYRLSCCEQSICGDCHSSLPEVCPVCEHTPLMKDDCKPNSSLRTTVTVFLRTAEKKHMMAKEKDQKAAAAAAAVGKQDDLNLATKTPTSPLKTISPFQKLSDNQDASANDSANGDSVVQEQTPLDSNVDGVAADGIQDGTQAAGFQGAGAADPTKGWDASAQGYNGTEWNNYNQAMMNQTAAWNYNPAMMGYQTPEMMAMMNQTGGYGMGAYGMGRGYAGQAGYGWNNGMNGWNQGYPAMGGNMGRGMNNGYVSAGGYRQQSHQQFPHQQFHKFGQHNTYRQLQAHHGMTNGPQGNVHEAGFKPADLKPADWNAQESEANAPQLGINDTTTEEITTLNSGDANSEVNGTDNLVAADDPPPTFCKQFAKW